MNRVGEKPGHDQGGHPLLRDGRAADAQVRRRAQQPRQRAQGAGKAGERTRTADGRGKMPGEVAMGHVAEVSGRGGSCFVIVGAGIFYRYMALSPEPVEDTEHR